LLLSFVGFGAAGLMQTKKNMTVMVVIACLVVSALAGMYFLKWHPFRHNRSANPMTAQVPVEVPPDQLRRDQQKLMDILWMTHSLDLSHSDDTLRDLNNFISRAKEPALLVIACLAKGTIETQTSKNAAAFDSYQRAAGYSRDLSDGKDNALTAQCYACLSACSRNSAGQTAAAGKESVGTGRESANARENTRSEREQFADKALKLLEANGSIPDKVLSLPKPLLPFVSPPAQTEAQAYLILADESANKKPDAANQKRTIDLYSKSISLIQEQQGEKTACALPICNLAKYLLRQGRKKEALKQINDLKTDLRDNASHNIGLATAWYQVGSFYRDIHQDKEARKAWTSGMQLVHEIRMEQSFPYQMLVEQLKKLDEEKSARR
jgi:hypothetical protein